VDQILARAQKIDSGVHLVTVYRTIDLLKKQGLIDELDCCISAATGTTTKLMGHAITFTSPACVAAVREFESRCMNN